MHRIQSQVSHSTLDVLGRLRKHLLAVQGQYKHTGRNSLRFAWNIGRFASFALVAELCRMIDTAERFLDLSTAERCFSEPQTCRRSTVSKRLARSVASENIYSRNKNEFRKPMKISCL